MASLNTGDRFALFALSGPFLFGEMHDFASRDSPEAEEKV